jgi:HD-GYP domain-containing protein (c-di-GMP phosphodiesterase class II)
VFERRIILRGLEELAGKTWESQQRLRVGRLENCDIKLDNHRVSREHAEILYTSQGWVVRDLRSTNGTFLNGIRLGGGDEVLRKGDILLFGDLCVTVAEFPAQIGSTNQLDDKIEILKAVSPASDTIGIFFAKPELTAVERNRMLQQLMQAGRNFASFQSLDAYLEAILWEAAEFLDARGGAIIIKEPTGSFAVRNVFALGGLANFQALLDQGLGEWAASRGASLLCRVKAGLSTHPTEKCDTSGKESEPGSMILAMLRSKDRDLGIMCLARSREHNPFDESDLFLTDALALSVSSSIECFDRLLFANRQLLSQSLTALSNLLYLRNGHARRRAGRITQYALFIANELGLSELDRYHLTIGTPLMDIGMFAIPDYLLEKTGPLTPREEMQVHSHVIKGVELLEAIPASKFLIPLVRNHHEHWDGSGYPDGLKGATIPLLARIAALADDFEAMTDPNPARHGPSLSLHEAIQEIQHHSGTQFDPACVSALLRVRPQIEELLRERGGLLRTVTAHEILQTVKDSGNGPGNTPPKATLAVCEQDEAAG